LELIGSATLAGGVRILGSDEGRSKSFDDGVASKGIIYRGRTDAQNEFHSLIDQLIGQGRGSMPEERL
jgi:hypothetical protein